MRTPESISRSYADSMAGSSPEEAKALMAEWEYVDTLCRHDWWYAYADDHRVFTEGQITMARLREMQPIVDPNFELWNRYCANGHQVKKA